MKILIRRSFLPGLIFTLLLTGEAFRPAQAYDFFFPSAHNDLRIPFDLNKIQAQLGLARESGAISDANLTSPDAFPEFILIQDVHQHPEVQKHIAEIILYGYHHWGVRKIFMEGAFVPVDLHLYQTVPDRLREGLLTRQLNDGDLSGPELAAVLLMDNEISGPYTTPFQLIGMEDPQLYRRNLEAYHLVEAHREEALSELQAITWQRRTMQIIDSPAYTEQLERTHQLIELKLTPAEYTAYMKNKVATPSSPKLDPAVAAAEHFYDLVYERSDIFLRYARKRVPAAPGPRVLVVGGFHTAVMAEQLRLEGRSFVVITPRVTESGYEKLYEEHMWESMNALRVVKTLPPAKTALR